MTGLLLCFLLLVTLGSGAALRAALRAADDPAPPPGRPSQAEIRERFKNLTPEERAARLKAIRESGGPMAEALQKRRAELEKLRQETKDLPPAQREARLREWRETNALSRPLATMSPEDRDAKRKLFQKRIEEQIAVLKKKTAEGSISEDETRRLRNMERMLKRLESGPVLAAPRPSLGLPPPAAPVKPAKPDEHAQPGAPAKSD